MKNAFKTSYMYVRYNLTSPGSTTFMWKGPKACPVQVKFESYRSQGQAGIQVFSTQEVFAFKHADQHLTLKLTKELEQSGE